MGTEREKERPGRIQVVRGIYSNILVRKRRRQYKQERSVEETRRNIRGVNLSLLLSALAS